jgi:hypothetical protein
VVPKLAVFAVVAFVATLVTGCGAKEVSTVTVTTPPVTVRVTVTAETTTEAAEPAPAPEQTESEYPPGYPREVPVSETPEQMDLYLRTDGATTAVALAPGVWVFDAPGTTVEDDAANGALVGWCASVEKFEADHPERSSGQTCW